MNPVESFFRKYGAVVTDKHGEPQWQTASDATLIGWAESDLAAWLANPTEHSRLIDRLSDVGNEIRRRQGLSGKSCGPEAEARLSAIAKIFGAIGWAYLRPESMTKPK